MMKFSIRKLESWSFVELPNGKEIMTLAFLVLTIPARDGQRDGQRDGHVAVAKTRA